MINSRVILGTATPDTVPPSSLNIPTHIQESILHEAPPSTVYGFCQHTDRIDRTNFWVL